MKSVMKSLRITYWIIFRSELDRILAVSVMFSISMSIWRLIFTGEYLAFIWNLFLAYIPYGITVWLKDRKAWTTNKLKFSLAFVAWLLCIPNSFYIITDFFHFKSYDFIPRWFDLILIFSFAWNGLLLGILSVKRMEVLVNAIWPLKHDWVFIYPIMWLNALGIYLGRYLRYNSWDVISNPFGLTLDIIERIMHPVEYRYVWGMVGVFSVFLTLMYLAIKRIGRALQ